MSLLPLLHRYASLTLSSGVGISIELPPHKNCSAPVACSPRAAGSTGRCTWRQQLRLEQLPPPRASPLWHPEGPLGRPPSTARRHRAQRQTPLLQSLQAARVSRAPPQRAGAPAAHPKCAGRAVWRAWPLRLSRPGRRCPPTKYPTARCCTHCIPFQCVTAHKEMKTFTLNNMSQGLHRAQLIL